MNEGKDTGKAPYTFPHPNGVAAYPQHAPPQAAAIVAALFCLDLHDQEGQALAQCSIGKLPD